MNNLLPISDLLKRTCQITGLLCILFILMPVAVHAQESSLTEEPSEIDELAPSYPVDESDMLPSGEYVRLAWAASSKGNFEELNRLVEECLRHYELSAQAMHAQLNNFPSRDQVEHYTLLNDVATCLFIRAEALMNQGKTEQAIEEFNRVIKEFPWSQSWDPSRGSYWSVAEKSQASIDMMTGKVEEEVKKDVPKTVASIHTTGTERFVDYTQYGEFKKVGTREYVYKIKDLSGLKTALGEGVYPNTGDIYKNPAFKKAIKDGRLEGPHWDFTNTDDLEAAYFKWATAPEPWGVRLFYMGIIFEKSGNFEQALKHYYALVVHFPTTTAWTYWQTPWYPAQAAIAKIKHIVREHPELGVTYKWGKIIVENGFDNDEKNDIIITYPGVIKKKSLWDMMMERAGMDQRREKLGKVKRRLGDGHVRLVQYENGHWQLLVDDDPFLIKGITYAPTKVGQSPDKGTLSNWMEDDFNRNGQIDGPYDAWIDANRNNKQDADEPTVGDFEIMKQMGVNTLRIYHQPSKVSKELLRKMHEEYGFMVIMGDFLGKYTLGSGADWLEGTDYENKQHKKNMMDSVRAMVEEFKDEPYILLWALGNENNYGVASNADKKPEAYFRFTNEVAKMIKSIDPDHPVVVCNGDVLFLDKFAKYAPAVDIYSANVYRGDYGFGSFWQQVQSATDKPAYISEYGAPAYAKGISTEEAETLQAQYHRGNWLDIQYNSATYADGAGNSIGGVAFEWLDEWWKNYEPAFHDKKSDVIGPFPGGYYYEEWFGLIGQGDGKSSPYLRQPRKVYYTYKDLWN